MISAMIIKIFTAKMSMTQYNIIIISNNHNHNININNGCSFVRAVIVVGVCCGIISVLLIVAVVDCCVFLWYTMTMTVMACSCDQTHLHPVLNGKEGGRDGRMDLRQQQ